MKTLKITTHWTTEEADCIYQLLDVFKSAVWECYGEDIVEMYREIENEQKNQEDGEFNDEMDFND
jgi:hypothetical protein